MGFADHVKEIERVGQESNTGRDAIVVESGRRCLDTYKLDSAQAREAVIVSQTRLREHRARQASISAPNGPSNPRATTLNGPIPAY